jgi:endonuclease/exonuclease/phosphatase family metal-dependent hydrolase
MSYNVENLFDDRDDGTEYREYDPGAGTWNTALYHAKLKGVSEALSLIGGGGPDICLLQEVENERAVSDLHEGYLNVLKYGYVVVAPSEGTATTVAALCRYRPTRVLTHRIHVLDAPPQRPILELQFDLRGGPLVVLNMHWKSKSGGAEATEPYRLAASAFVAERVSHLRNEDPDRSILVAGDLNEREDEYERVSREYPTALMREGVGGAAGSLYLAGALADVGVRDGRVVFFSPWLTSASPGSYAYRGEWERVDHFLFLPGADGGFVVGEFRVVDDELLLNSAGYPYRWNAGSAGGFSDHLPILIELEH